MKRALIGILAGLGALVAVSLLVLVVVSLIVVRQDPLPERVILEVDLRKPLVETSPTDPLLLALEGRKTRVRDVVEGLHRAAADDRVEGLLVRGGDGVGGWAITEEVRNAVLHFRESGKPAWYHADSFGEVVPAQGAVYLASAFERVTIHPSADVGLAPLVLEMPFLRGALDSLGIDPRFQARHEYKDAVHLFTESGFTEESREALLAVLETLEGRLVEGLVEGRGLGAEAAREAVRGGPWSAAEGLEMGLVDELAYESGVRDALREATEDAEFASLALYRDRTRGTWERGSRVALVYANGAIQRGEGGGFDPLGGGASMGGDAVARHVREAAERPGVEAILLRVDSPGGSWIGSDQIRHEVERAREAGIPVVVSMGNAAASGGYVISLDADRIVAQPTTLTGSIGVAGGKLVVRDFMARWGIDWDQVSLGEEEPGGFATTTGDFTPEEWERFGEQMDRVYDDFVDHVARGRGMERDEAEAVSRGRVWTGADALELGLVDRMGGFPEALEEIRELLELDVDEPLRVTVFPAEPGLLEILLSEDFRGGIRAGDGSLLEGVVRGLRVLQGLGELGRDGMISPGAVRTAPVEVPGS
ncbi:MAG: signal peptide peptidase SppA [Gemmatimonadales bacterium]|nr:MAG: signal peptide peptidase SppA [Gemmatimonadales bacterium]